MEYLTPGRKGAKRVRGTDPLHAFMPYLMPNRADNEAFIREQVDLENILAWLEKKNAAQPQYPYTIFHVILAATHRAMVLRPKMNRFISGRRTYQRDKVSLAFVAKKKFADDGAEALLLLEFENDATVQTIHDRIWEKVSLARRDEVTDSTTGAMAALAKLPRPLLRLLIRILLLLDYHGRVPGFLIEEDPDFASVFLSNLGSIGLDAVYHHLNNWGTNSVFVVVGRKHRAPVCMDDGSIQAREVLDLGITLDERIADGYYYAGTVKLIKELLQHPERLEIPANPEEAEGKD